MGQMRQVSFRSSPASMEELLVTRPGSPGSVWITPGLGFAGGGSPGDKLVFPIHNSVKSRRFAVLQIPNSYRTVISCSASRARGSCVRESDAIARRRSM